MVSVWKVRGQSIVCQCPATGVTRYGHSAVMDKAVKARSRQSVVLGRATGERTGWSQWCSPAPVAVEWQLWGGQCSLLAPKPRTMCSLLIIIIIWKISVKARTVRSHNHIKLWIWHEKQMFAPLLINGARLNDWYLVPKAATAQGWIKYVDDNVMHLHPFKLVPFVKKEKL